jgi:hypothetical protein
MMDTLGCLRTVSSDALLDSIYVTQDQLKPKAYLKLPR